MSSCQRTNPPNVLATPLYVQESSLDFAMRVSRLLARKLQMPVYVGNSISFASAGLGGTVEEEMEGMKTCVEVIMHSVDKAKDGIERS